VSRPRTTLLLEDVWNIVKGRRLLFTCLAIAGATAGLLWRLNQPVMYQAEGTFREEAPKKSGLAQFLELDPRGANSDPTIVMGSRTLVEQVVRRECLQAQLCEDQNPLQAFVGRIEAEVASLTPGDALEVARPYLRCSLVDYPLSTKTRLKIRVDEGNQFTVLSPSGSELVVGNWGEAVSLEGYRFALHKHGDMEPGTVWKLTLVPFRNTVAAMQKRLEASSDADMAGVINVTACHHIPEEAASMANGLMAAYKYHLADREEDRLRDRLVYLRRRQDESRREVRQLLMQYADRLAQRNSSVAFMGLENEMEFLSERQEKALAKLREVELQLQQINGLPPRDAIHLVSPGQSQVAQELMAQLHQHQLQAALLDESLKNEMPIARVAQMRQAEVARAQREIAQAMASLSEPGSPSQQGDWSPLTSPWWKRLDAARQASETAVEDQRETTAKELARGQQLFEEYLKEHEASLALQNKLLETAALDTHAFDGLEPSTVNGLYLQYEQQQREVEVRLHQMAFLLDQLATGKWEGAGAPQAVDPAMGRLIERATALRVKIDDTTHYAPKEVVHYQEEYQRVGALLGAQLRQQTHLEQLNLQLIQSKLWELRRLQRAWLDQRMQHLDQQITQCLSSTRQTLTNERRLLKEQLAEMNSGLKDVPQQWVDEQELIQASELATQVLTKTVEVAEAQMIAHHLEQLEARPLDMALTPLKPQPPHLLLGTIAGALASLWAGGSLLIGWRFLRGLRINRLHLQRLGAQVLGSLKPGEEMSTLRRLAAFLDTLPKTPSGGAIALLQGTALDYTPNLCQILTIMGKRCAVIETTFTTPAAPGLLEYLEGRTPQPHLEKVGVYDRLTSGGITQCGFELLKSRAMASLMDRLRAQYDWIFLTSTSPIGSVEHTALTPLADATIVSLHSETIDTVHDSGLLHSQQPTAFVLWS
jgi:hypothetical protein